MVRSRKGKNNIRIKNNETQGIKEFFLVSGKREKYREGLNYSHYDYNIFKRINFLKNASLFLLLQVVQMRYHFFLFFFFYGESRVTEQARFLCNEPLNDRY